MGCEEWTTAFTVDRDTKMSVIFYNRCIHCRRSLAVSWEPIDIRKLYKAHYEDCHVWKRMIRMRIAKAMRRVFGD